MANIISTLISAVLGGVVVAILNYLLNRKKNQAEIEKIEAETSKIKLETKKLSNSINNIDDTQHEQEERIDEIQKFLVRHFITEDKRKHLKNFMELETWPLKKDKTTSFFYNELRDLRSSGLIKGKKDKGIRSLDKEGGNIKSHFEITKQGIKYIEMYEKTIK